MNEKLKASLGQLWLMIGVFCLLLPVFLPSLPASQSIFSNIGGLVTAIMFILSFPMSLFGLPLMFVIDRLAGVDPQSINGMYLNLCLLFAFGYVQWFWIVPRFLGSEAKFRMSDLFGPGPEGLLTEAKTEHQVNAYKSQNTTPLEPVKKL